MKVETIHSHGSKPKAEKIENTINEAEEEGYKLYDTDCYGTRIETDEPLHVVILYFEERV